MNILGEKDVDRIDADRCKDLAARSLQTAGCARPAAACDDYVVALSSGQGIELLDKGCIAKIVKEKEIDARFKSSPNTARALARVRCQAQPACRRTADRKDFRFFQTD
jgi:hypothetical protein